MFSLDDVSPGNKDRPDTSTVTAKRMLASALNMPSMKASSQEKEALKVKKETRLKKSDLPEK